MDDINPIPQNPVPDPLDSELTPDPETPEPPKEFSLPMESFDQTQGKPDELPSAYNDSQLPDAAHLEAEPREEPRSESPVPPELTRSDSPRYAPPQRPFNQTSSRSASAGGQGKPFSQTQGKQMPEAIFHIEVEKIKPNPHQPRR